MIYLHTRDHMFSFIGSLVAAIYPKDKYITRTLH
jgi:hypothetical protein